MEKALIYSSRLIGKAELWFEAQHLTQKERERGDFLIASRILLEMNCCGQWKSVVVMIAVNFGLAITNVLFKKILDKGVSLIIILMYRQAISAVFLAPIAFFWER